MQLQTRRPPGHANRKVLGFAADIQRLRAEGHSLSAIREALEDAGTVVSISTVRREVMRTALPSALKQAAAAATVVPRTAPRLLPGSVVIPPTPVAPLQGKAVAEAFMRAHPTNPLFRKEPTP